MTEIFRDATIGDDDEHIYRYDLTRTWQTLDARLELLMWIMLNPSTADGTKDDPTIRRCMGFARREKCTGIVVCNLFAYRATDPAELGQVLDPVGPRNAQTIDGWLTSPSVKRVVCAWGSKVAGQRIAVEAMAERAHVETVCLGRTKLGAPRHPLYVAKSQPLEPWTP